ncbi:MAG: hypothetical protein WDZ63_12205 [Burkholderiales bacterium]
MNRQWLLLFALAAGAAGAAFAHHGRMQEHLLKVEVLGSGVYAQASEGFVRTAGHARADSRAVLVRPGDRVARVAGEQFGFCFEVSGFLEDGEVDLQKIITHPPVPAGNQAVSGYVSTIELDVAGGRARGCIGHTLEGGDLVAGRWVVALGAGETTLAERSFTVE